jgi:hypothetical protein
MPLIHWELRPNWVRFVILCFRPLGAPAPASETHERAPVRAASRHARLTKSSQTPEA